MYTAVYSPKAGVGVTSTAALLAMSAAARAEPTLLVDLDGDAPAVLGIDEPGGPGVVQWATTPGRSDEALARIAIEAAPDLSVAARGDGPFPASADALAGALHRRSGHVVVDAGSIDTGFGAEIVRCADQRLLVVRCCYLALRAAAADSLQATGVIVVREPNRALGLADVESVVGSPVVASIAVDPAVARAIDAGLLRARPPRRLLRAMAAVMVTANRVSHAN